MVWHYLNLVRRLDLNPKNFVNRNVSHNMIK